MCILLHHRFKNSGECFQISASLPPSLAGMGGMPVPPRSKSNLLLTAKPLAKWVSASVHTRMHAAQSCFLLCGWGGGGLGACSLMGKGLFFSLWEATHSDLRLRLSCFQELWAGLSEIGFSITFRWTTGVFCCYFSALLACLLGFLRATIDAVGVRPLWKSLAWTVAVSLSPSLDWGYLLKQWYVLWLFLI